MLTGSLCASKTVRCESEIWLWPSSCQLAGEDCLAFPMQVACLSHRRQDAVLRQTPEGAAAARPAVEAPVLARFPEPARAPVLRQRQAPPAVRESHGPLVSPSIIWICCLAAIAPHAPQASALRRSLGLRHGWPIATPSSPYMNCCCLNATRALSLVAISFGELRHVHKREAPPTLCAK